MRAAGEAGDVDEGVGGRGVGKLVLVSAGPTSQGGEGVDCYGEGGGHGGEGVVMMGNC